MGKNFKQSMVFKASALLLALLLALPGHLVFAQTNNIVGNLLLPSVPYDPPVLRGIKLDPANPLKFDFIVYEGQNPLSQAALKIESAKLIRYFLAGLTIPENDLWVNLSPYERDKIVPQEFSQTDIGKEMLAQDYLLKQLAASLTCPETEAGKKYWDEINNYTTPYGGSSTKSSPAAPSALARSSFTKVWIMPQEVVVFQDKDRAFVKNIKFKVMMDNDYAAMNKNGVGARSPRPLSGRGNPAPTNAFKRHILPLIEKEVNTGKNFAPLRQVTYSIMLAAWFKGKLKENIINKLYSDKKKIKGIETNDPAIKEKIYQQYLEAFKKGAYDYIKAEGELPLTPSLAKRGDEVSALALVKRGPAQPGRVLGFGTRITHRHYFSGGIKDGVVDNVPAIEYIARHAQPLGSATATEREAIAKNTHDVVARLDRADVLTPNPLQPLVQNKDLRAFIELFLERRYTHWGLPVGLSRKIVDSLADNSGDLGQAMGKTYQIFAFEDDQRWRSAYAKYKEADKYTFGYHQIADRLQGLPAGAVILDVGAGNNLFGATIAENLPQAKVIGTDTLVYDEKRPLSNLAYIPQPSKTELPRSIADHSVDVITMNAVRHHIGEDDFVNLLEEMKRVLKPGGKIILIEDTYSLRLPVEGDGNNLLTQEFLTLVKKHGPQFARDFFSFNDWYANQLVHRWYEMHMEYDFRSIEEWQADFARRGFAASYAQYNGFPAQGFHKPSLGVLEFVNSAPSPAPAPAENVLCREKFSYPFTIEPRPDLTPEEDKERLGMICDAAQALLVEKIFEINKRLSIISSLRLDSSSDVTLYDVELKRKPISLVAVIANAVDAIATEATRLGAPYKGVIEFTFIVEHGRLILKVSDNGTGIGLETFRALASGVNPSTKRAAKERGEQRTLGSWGLDIRNSYGDALLKLHGGTREFDTYNYRDGAHIFRQSYDKGMQEVVGGQRAVPGTTVIWTIPFATKTAVVPSASAPQEKGGIDLVQAVKGIKTEGATGLSGFLPAQTAPDEKSFIGFTFTIISASRVTISDTLFAAAQ